MSPNAGESCGVSANEYTDKKENEIFLLYKEIQNGAVGKSYVRKGFLIYEKIRKYLNIHEEPLVIYGFAIAPL
jgi:hypothetical protein